MAVKNSDMYYAYSNNEGIKEKGEYGGVVTTIMKHLLESNVAVSYTHLDVYKRQQQ